MSDWTWEYVPDATNVLVGLTRAQINEVESLFKACPQGLAEPQLRITIT
jgi:hypothetical protein